MRPQVRDLGGVQQVLVGLPRDVDEREELVVAGRLADDRHLAAARPDRHPAARAAVLLRGGVLDEGLCKKRGPSGQAAGAWVRDGWLELRCQA